MAVKEQGDIVEYQHNCMHTYARVAVLWRACLQLYVCKYVLHSLLRRSSCDSCMSRLWVLIFSSALPDLGIWPQLPSSNFVNFNVFFMIEIQTYFYSLKPLVLWTHRSQLRPYIYNPWQDKLTAFSMWSYADYRLNGQCRFVARMFGICPFAFTPGRDLVQRVLTS